MANRNVASGCRLFLPKFAAAYWRCAHRTQALPSIQQENIEPEFRGGVQHFAHRTTK
jgi:hypothetical protein